MCSIIYLKCFYTADKTNYLFEQILNLFINLLNWTINEKRLTLNAKSTYVLIFVNVICNKTVTDSK